MNREIVMDRTDVSGRLQALMGEALGAEPASIGMDQTLLELGADSLVLYDVLERLKAQFGIDISLRQLFVEFPTLQTIADFIENMSCAGYLPDQPDRAGMQVAALGVVFGKSEVPSAEAAVAELEAHAGHPAEPLSRGESASPSAGRLQGPSWITTSVKPPTPSATGMVQETDTRKNYLQDFVPRYVARTTESKKHAAAVRKRVADSRTSIGFRSSLKEIVYPIVSNEMAGSHTRDIDGNDYVDMTMGFGVHLFGHNPAFLSKSLRERVTEGFGIGLRNPLALEVANLLAELTGMDRFAFVNSGTEAVMNAVRAARAMRKQDKIVIFSASYHGHWDAVLAASSVDRDNVLTRSVSAGVPDSMVSDVVVLEFGSTESIRYIEAHADRIAAVLIEPVPTRDPALCNPAYLHKLRDATRRHGVLLIFDEIVTGFRCHQAGVQGLFGVDADIATYGKVIGGGLPIGIVAGRDTMLDSIDGGAWTFGDDSFPAVEPSFFGGTFFQHPLSLLAAYETLQHLKNSGPSFQMELDTRTEILVSRLNDLFQRHDVPIVARRFSSFFRLIHSKNFDLLYYNLLLRGIYIWEWRCWFMSAAHEAADIDKVVTAMDESLTEMKNSNLIE